MHAHNFAWCLPCSVFIIDRTQHIDHKRRYHKALPDISALLSAKFSFRFQIAFHASDRPSSASDPHRGHRQSINLATIWARGKISSTRLSRCTPTSAEPHNNVRVPVQPSSKCRWTSTQAGRLQLPTSPHQPLSSSPKTKAWFLWTQSAGRILRLAIWRTW